jgi:hypothetical protein
LTEIFSKVIGHGENLANLVDDLKVERGLNGFRGSGFKVQGCFFSGVRRFGFVLNIILFGFRVRLR